jgi:acyl-CoA synthetase (NDP forming)
MDPMDDSHMKRIEDALTTALEAGRERLHEHEIYELLGLLGFRTPAVLFVEKARELEGIDLSPLTGGSVVCKLISEQMLHRFEHGGVRFTKPDREELVRIFRDFEKIAGDVGIPLRGMMIAEMVEGSDCIPHQLLLSLRQDASFGPVVFMGLGGVGTEIYKESLKEERALFVRAAADVSDEEGTKRALERTLFYPILTGGTRISSDPMVDGGKLLEAIQALAALGERFSPLSRSPVTIEELEINPLQITGDGGIMPLDALLKISGSKSETMHPPQSGIGRLLEPETVLIIGASANKLNTGRIILRNIVEGGRIGRNNIYLLHPEAKEIDGCRTYRSIDDIPVRADMAVFTIPANERAAELLEHIIDSEKASAVTIISGGFGETENGKELDRRLHKAIGSGRVKNGGGVVVNGPNCLGIVSRPGGYNTFFLPEYKLPFIGKYGERCAFISQSGAYLVTLVSNITKLINPKYMITYGNQMDLTATDYLIYMKDDPEIDLFVIYLEGFKPYDGERFLRVVKQITASGKKIVMYKTGRTPEGAAAVASHTASMAGNYEILYRILVDAGVMIPDTLNEIEDAIKVFSLLSGKKVRGRRIAVIGNAGFECSVAADRLYSMQLAEFSDETVAKLHEALPSDIIDVHNPVDITPQTNSVNFGKCLEAFVEDENIDCILASIVAPTPFMETLPAGDGHSEDIMHEDSFPNVTIRNFKSTKKPMVVSVDSGSLYDPAVDMMENAGIPVFRKVDRAMKALDNFLVHSDGKD